MTSRCVYDQQGFEGLKPCGPERQNDWHFECLAVDRDETLYSHRSKFIIARYIPVYNSYG